MSIDTLTYRQFKQLPLVAEGESKEVRYYGDGLVVIRLKPTIYSFTHNRAGTIEGSDRLRLQAIKSLLPVLQAAGIKHTYRHITDRWILSDLVLQPHLEGRAAPFRPDDLTIEQVAVLPLAPPLEIVVKAVHSGTPKHRYHDFSSYPLRRWHGGGTIKAMAAYPAPIVRFDWRNPMVSDDGERLADEVLPEAMAQWFIDVPSASKTAFAAFRALQAYLVTKELVLWDICFFIAQDGTTMFGEVSPDCLRVRAADGTALDKDIWRAGGSSQMVLAKWQAFVNVLRST